MIKKLHLGLLDLDIMWPYLNNQTKYTYFLSKNNIYNINKHNYLLYYCTINLKIHCNIFLKNININQ